MSIYYVTGELDLVPAVAEIMEDIGQRMVKELRQSTPRSSGSGGRYDHLADNWTYKIYKKKDEVSMNVFGGNKWFIVHFKENGTVKQAKDPILTPIFEKYKKIYLQEIQNINLDEQIKTTKYVVD